MNAPCRARFVTLAARRCLLAEWLPGGASACATLLVIQAFGDEANLSRRMVRLLAEALQPLGVHTVLADCSGTGDSEGDLADAGIRQWLMELGALQAMQGRARPLFLLGVRFGAWLAMALPVRSRGVLLWSPVLSGSDLLRERARREAMHERVVRDRSAPCRAQPGGPASNPAEPGAALLAELATCEPSPPGPHEPVAIFDVRLAQAAEPGRRVRELVRAWQARGCSVQAVGVPGAAFWQVPDPIDCPALITATTARLRSWL